MATRKQIVANRQNAAKSTSPRTQIGKLSARQNASRHGLTAETVIHTIEDAESYRNFEREIKANYRPQTTIEHELVARLASLLWRLRRAIAIESGLLQIEASRLRDTRTNENSAEPTTENKLGVFYDLIPFLGPAKQAVNNREVGQTQCAQEFAIDLDLARSFSRLTSFESAVFDRLGRYETRLWRQLRQLMPLIGKIEKANREPVFLGGKLLGFTRAEVDE